jgi:hypothetical protein
MSEQELENDEEPTQMATKRTNKPAHTSRTKSSSPEEVLSLLKSYLEERIEDKDKRSEEKAKADRQASKLKSKGNQKQFEFNAGLEDLFRRIVDSDDKDDIEALAKEGIHKIKRRQKTIKIADKEPRDGWKVVDEYLSDELASDSEDDKKLKKARKAVAEKRKKEDNRSLRQDKRPRYAGGSSEKRLFRGKKMSRS